MAVKLLIPIPSTLYTYLSIFFLFFCSIDVSAQCAGNDDNTLSVCVIPDDSSKTIDLGARLGPHTAGGTWTDNGLSGGLNVTTGILNAQQINRSGIFTYTYTVNNVVGCVDNSATVTVTIGPYAGVGSKGNTCSDNTSYNLFQAFDIRDFIPQINGTWHDDDGSGGLSGNILNATIPVVGQTYRYTYTVGAVGVCTVPSSQQIEVTIVPVPKPGTANDLKLCSDQLPAYTNYNLNNALSGQDPNGFWSEAGTNELSGPTDSTIDIQNIYNTKGPGTYSFSYTVLGNGICPRSVDVSVTIEKQLDFSGVTLDINQDICEDEILAATYTAVLTQGTLAIANGSYEVTYTISGEALPLKITRNFVNGVFTFPIASSYFQQIKDYTITILNIASTTGLPGVCNSIVGTLNDVLHVYPIPKINNATLKIEPKCQNEDVLVEFSGTSNLVDGNYEIIYNLSGSNIVNGMATIVTVGGGLFSFYIPNGLIPNAGTSTVTITNITNSATLCTNTSTLAKDFIVNPLPNVSNLAVTIKDVCQGQSATVKLTGLGALTSITLTYTISGFNTVASQNIPLAVNAAGESTFPILATDIPITGLTSFTITNVTNAITGCPIAINKKTDFTVNPLPNLPVAAAVQPFCASDNATVANLMPQGSQYQWFDSITSNVPLISTTLITAGDYFVKEVNTLTGCESSLKSISVLINATPQINSGTLTIAPVCQGYPVNVGFSGTSNLADGNYSIVYNLSGSNVATAVQDILNVTSGVASFTIDPNLIPKAGNTTIAITNIKNSLTNCLNTSTLTKVFVINALPDVSTMVVTVKDGCLGQPLSVQLSGLGALTNITLSYAVSGANRIDSQAIPLVVSAGNASFLIPAAALSATGNNTLVITDLTNRGNSCTTIINSVSNNFAMQIIPISPTASNQEFCETNLSTVANLVPNGNQYQWFDTATSKTPLSSSALLATANYYLKEISAITGCASNPTSVGVLINSVTAPILNPSGQNFCGVDKPTIQNLSDNTTASGNLAWYDAATNGMLLANTEILSEGFTYYGIDSSTITNCRSYALEVTVSLTDCTATPENFFIPDGFSPNGDGVNETFQIIDIEFLFPNYTLEIFNRYGNVLFKGNINKPAWDGKNSNSNFIDGDTPTGVYFYIIHYNKDNLPPKQGQLYLNR